MSELTRAYRVIQAACGIEAGNDVEVLMKPRSYANGWEFSGAGVLDEDVGRVFTVKAVYHDAIVLPPGPKGARYLPCFAVRLIEKAKPELPAGVTFTADGLKVGEVYLSKDTIKRNLGL